MEQDEKMLGEYMLDALDRLYDNETTILELYYLLFATARALTDNQLKTTMLNAESEVLKITKSSSSPQEKRRLALIATDKLRCQLAERHPL